MEIFRKTEGAVRESRTRLGGQAQEIDGAKGTITTLHAFCLEIKSVTHAFSTRLGGESPISRREFNLGFTPHLPIESAEKNRKMFFRALALEGLPFVPLKQTHGATAHFVDKFPDTTLKGDGVFTSRSGFILGVGTADCVPVLVAHRRGEFIGALHAGWRGTSARFIPSALSEAISRYGAKPEDIFAAFGPSVRPCCYGVKEDVVLHFKKNGHNVDKIFREQENGDYKIDLAEENAKQILSVGVPPENIEIIDRCTFCAEMPVGTPLFFSYRRDKERAGTMLSVIAKVSD